MRRQEYIDRTILLIMTLFIMQGNVMAQTIIEGSVLDEQGKAVDVYVTVTAKGAGNILAMKTPTARVTISWK